MPNQTGQLAGRRGLPDRTVNLGRKDADTLPLPNRSPEYATLGHTKGVVAYRIGDVFEAPGLIVSLHGRCYIFLGDNRLVLGSDETWPLATLVGGNESVEAGASRSLRCSVRNAQGTIGEPLTLFDDDGETVFRSSFRIEKIVQQRLSVYSREEIDRLTDGVDPDVVAFEADLARALGVDQTPPAIGTFGPTL